MISFVIPVRNDALRLRRCLQSIKASLCPRGALELIVVDNGSTDDSAAVARHEGATVLLLPGASLGELRNQGARSARGEILAFVDADNEIVPGWVDAAMRALDDERVAAVGAPYQPPSPPTWVQRFYDRLRRHPRDREIVEWLGSGNMAVRRSAFDAAGGFDTSLDTCEDVDLCRKLRSLGHTLVSDPRLESVHHGDPRTLRHVFFGELWRGRDNVRVSLRRPRSWRTLVSAAIPVFNLIALGALVIGVLSGAGLGLTIAALATLFVVAVVSLRTSLMVGGESGNIPRAFAVAAAYELGRALSLAGRFGYGGRRRGAVA
jgi:glycosyltransferase involved in cell wall biosynthesis